MKALVHSSGGSKGSWGAGVIKHLLGDLQIHYSILAGTSVGAINASFISQFPIGEEKHASKALEELWLKLNNSKIFTRWSPFGRLHAAWKMSFYDSSPLHKIIRENIILNKVRSSGKLITVGAVSLS